MNHCWLWNLVEVAPRQITNNPPVYTRRRDPIQRQTFDVTIRILNFNQGQQVRSVWFLFITDEPDLGQRSGFFSFVVRDSISVYALLGETTYFWKLLILPISCWVTSCMSCCRKWEPKSEYYFSTRYKMTSDKMDDFYSASNKTLMV